MSDSSSTKTDKSNTNNNAATKPAPPAKSSSGFFSFAAFPTLPSSIGRPVGFEDISREVKGTQPANFAFDGGKAELEVKLSPNFGLQHVISAGSQSPGASNYNFVSLYHDDVNVCHGQISSSGLFSGRFIRKLYKDRLEAKTSVQRMLTTGDTNYNFDIDASGDTFQTGLKVENPNPFNNTGSFALSYMQSLAKKVSAGIQLVYARPYPKFEGSYINYAVRYQSPNRVLSALWQGNSVLNVCYLQNVSEKILLSSEIDISAVPKLESMATIAAQISSSVYQVRLSLSTRLVSSITWDIMAGDRVTLSFSGNIDHVTGGGKFGIGFRTEMSQ